MYGARRRKLNIPLYKSRENRTCCELKSDVGENGSPEPGAPAAAAAATMATASGFSAADSLTLSPLLLFGESAVGNPATIVDTGFVLLSNCFRSDWLCCCSNDSIACEQRMTRLLRKYTRNNR